MIDFRKPKITDKPWVDECLRKADFRGCEYNFTNILAWGNTYGQGIAQIDGFLTTHFNGQTYGAAYLYPAGEGNTEQVIRVMAADAQERGISFRLCGLCAQQVESLRRNFPDAFHFEADRNGSDYLYDINRLADLPGKKLHAKRNHINRFVENNPNWHYDVLRPEDIPECLALEREWYQASMLREGKEEAQDLGDEGYALRQATAYYEELELEGGVLRVDGKLVAFTIGSRISFDTYDVHFEKAYHDLQGAYPMINREFAPQLRTNHPEIRYLNRENDMGIPGLRKAKESYYPDLLVEKYFAILEGSSLH